MKDKELSEIRTEIGEIRLVIAVKAKELDEIGSELAAKNEQSASLQRLLDQISNDRIDATATTTTAVTAADENTATSVRSLQLELDSLSTAHSAALEAHRKEVLTQY